MGDLVARVAGNAIGVLVYIIGCKVINWIKVKPRPPRRHNGGMMDEIQRKQ